MSPGRLGGSALPVALAALLAAAACESAPGSPTGPSAGPDGAAGLDAAWEASGGSAGSGGSGAGGRGGWEGGLRFDSGEPPPDAEPWPFDAPDGYPRYAQDGDCAVPASGAISTCCDGVPCNGFCGAWAPDAAPVCSCFAEAGCSDGAVCCSDGYVRGCVEPSRCGLWP